MPRSESRVEYERRWKRENRDLIHEWTRSNPHKIRSYKDRRIEKAREDKIRAFAFFGWHCFDCGETDIDVIEFDHVRGEKVAGPAALQGAAHYQEVTEKCEPVCANCHRRRTRSRHLLRMEQDRTAITERTGMPVEKEETASVELTAAYVLSHVLPFAN